MASISISAQRCRELFHQVCELGATRAILDRYATFNIWASNIGVFAEGHASLDFRLRELSDEKELVVQYLVLITDSLRQLHTHLLQYNNRGECPPNPQEPLLMLTEDEIHKLTLDITDSLNWLRRLSNAVRKASVQNQNSQARNFALVDEDGNDISSLLKTLFTHFIKRDYPGLSEQLRERVALGMLIQRRQILYRKSRQEKLVLRDVAPTKPLQVLQIPTIKPSTITVAGDSTTSPQTELPQHRQSNPLSQYTATTIDVNQFRKVIAPPSRISVTRTAPLSGQDRVLLPPAPKIGDEDLHFVCPYCYMVIQRQVACDRNSWVDHIQGDLSPYICLFDQCDDDVTIFSSKEEWTTHMKFQHMMRWRCVSRDHKVLVFDTQAHFVAHVEEQHLLNFTRDQLNYHAESSAYPIDSIFEVCPFCSEEGESLEEHVGNHLRNLAIRSLPWPDTVGSDVVGDSNDSKTASLDSESLSTARYSKLLTTQSSPDTHVESIPINNEPLLTFDDIPWNSAIRQIDVSVPDHNSTEFDACDGSLDAPLRFKTWGFLPQFTLTNDLEDTDSIIQTLASAQQTARIFTPISIATFEDRLNPIKEIGNGAFGTTILAKVRTGGSSFAPPGTMIAVKVLKRRFESLSACLGLREVIFFRTVPPHPCIVKAFDIFLDPSTRRLHICLETMDSNLKQFMNLQSMKPLKEDDVRYIVFQVLSGLEHIHSHQVFHRDITPDNILISSSTTLSTRTYNIKIADFGLAREIHSKSPLTTYISTRWYRAPEVLLRDKDYSPAIDLWAVGTIAVELAILKPIFPGSNEVDQFWRITEILGSPGYWYTKSGAKIGGGEWKMGSQLAHEIGFTIPKMAPHAMSNILPSLWSPAFSNFATWCLMWDPSNRPSATQALDHEIFTSIRTGETRSTFLDTFMPNDIVFVVMGPAGASKSSFISSLAKTQSKSRISNMTFTECISTSEKRAFLAEFPTFENSDSNARAELVLQLKEAKFQQIPISGVIYLCPDAMDGLPESDFWNWYLLNQIYNDNKAMNFVFVTTMAPPSTIQEKGRYINTELQSFFRHFMDDKNLKTFHHNRGFESAKEIVDYLIDVNQTFMFPESEFTAIEMEDKQQKINADSHLGEAISQKGHKTSMDHKIKNFIRDTLHRSRRE